MFETRDLGAIPTGKMFNLLTISFELIDWTGLLIVNFQNDNSLGNDGQNYSSNFYRINDWYKAWLPDDAHIKQLHDTKTVYDVRIRYANNTNATYSFHGPRGKNQTSY